MRKIFFAIALTLVCLLNAPVLAKDVWISSGGNGSEWYVVDETIEGDDKGKFRWTNAKLKLVERNGDVEIISWNFTQTSPDGDRLANWVYEIVYEDGKRYNSEVLAGTNAEKILLYCLNHLGI